MMRARRRSKPWQEGEEAQINLTPLLDVVFNVLIMFMVIAPMLQIDQVQLAQGARDSLRQAQKEVSSRALTIQVKKDNTLWIEGRQMVLEKLKAYLLEMKKLHPHVRPLLLHDRNATFGTYQSIKDIIEQAGYEELDVLLQP